jgi:EmrB/QacA subfamily drug resistance transporter
MMVGFFMILVDSTIVAVANPTIMAALDIGYDTVIWVTSAYLLAYAVPLLVAGRLGDRFGPKNLYLIGLAVFTVASLWCGLAGSVEILITARMVQGVGAALLTPQTLSMITRIFPPERRGMAMSVWGATAGVATLIGPLAGGVLVDWLGWEWIFFVNVPVGVVGLGLAFLLIPDLPTHPHRFDPIGVGSSGAGLFLIVFALQEGQSSGWAPWIWAVLVAGLGFLAVFVCWQAVNTREPLIPLGIFRDRDFSLSNLGVAVIGFVATAMVLPVMFYAQAVCQLSPTRSAVLTAPTAIATGLLAPVVGRIVDRAHPRAVIGFGFSVLAIALTWLSIEMTATTPIWRLVLPFTAIGVGMAFVWSPLAATATRNLPPRLAGAGSGVYNATRQVGAVLGSASMAAFMTSRISADMPSLPDGGPPRSPGNAAGTVLRLPELLHQPFSAAMSESTLLPAFIALFGVAAALFTVGLVVTSARQPRWALAGAGGDTPGPIDDVGDIDADTADDPTELIPTASDDCHGADDYDDDDYVEYTYPARHPAEPEPDLGVRRYHDGPDTEPLAARAALPQQAPSEVGHTDPVASWRHLANHHRPMPAPELEPIGFAHNGFYMDGERRFRPVADVAPVDDDTAPRHRLVDDRQCRNRHYRADPGEAGSLGRHAYPEDWP